MKEKQSRNSVGHEQINLKLYALIAGNISAEAVLEWLKSHGAVYPNDTETLLKFLRSANSSDKPENLRLRIQAWITVRAL